MYFMEKIMIIGDDESISNELKELLQNSGYEAVILIIHYLWIWLKIYTMKEKILHLMI